LLEGWLEGWLEDWLDGWLDGSLEGLLEGSLEGTLEIEGPSLGMVDGFKVGVLLGYELIDGLSDG